MRCIPVDTNVCAGLLALWAGVNYVVPGREATLLTAATGERPARQVTLVAEQRPTNRLLELVVILETIAGILVVLGAAWLVWTRPGAMTWGFFVYVIQFNPGQAFQFYAWLQLWPRALLVQDVIAVVMQAAAYVGLILFALRAPVDRIEGRWRLIERALPALAILFLAPTLAGLVTVFGFRAETWMRSSFLIGFAASAAALAILLDVAGTCRRATTSESAGSSGAASSACRPTCLLRSLRKPRCSMACSAKAPCLTKWRASFT